MTTSSTPASFPAELGIIHSSLVRIRRRLYTVRLFERITLALLYCAPFALIVLATRLLLERFGPRALILPALPLVPLLCLIIPPLRQRLPARLSLLRFLAPDFLFLAAALTLLALALFISPYWLAIPIWLIPSTFAALFILAAILTAPAPSTRAVAIFVDQHAGLREKVATALEWADRPSASAAEAAFHAPLIASAAAACQQVQVARVGYARLDRRAYAIAAACLAAGSLLATVHPMHARAIDITRPNPQVLAQAANLSKVLADLEKDRPATTDPKTDQALAPLTHAVSELRKTGHMSNLEAMAKLGEARSQLKETADRQNADEAAHEALQANQSTRDLATAADKMKAADMKASSGDSAAQAQRDAAERALADAAKSAGDKLASGKMGAQEKKDLASGLHQAASKAASDKQLQQSLEGAAKAAEAGDGKSMAQNMNDAGNRMGEQMSDHALTGESLKEAMRAADSASDNLGGEQSMHDQANGGSNSGDSSSGSPGSQGEQASGNLGSQDGNQQGGNGGDGGQNSAGNGSQGGGQQGGKQGGQPGAQAAGSSSAGRGGDDGRTQDSGSTGMETPGGPGQHHGTEIHGDKTFVKIYDERDVANAGKTHKVTANISRGPSAGSMDVLGPGDKDDAVMTYESQLPAARKLAQDAMNKQQIPPQYRDLIHDYYEK